MRCGSSESRSPYPRCDERTRRAINDAIFEELCVAVFRRETTDVFVHAIEELRSEGADCAILGCTEIPLIISDSNSPLPVLDSTRLLAKYAVIEALKGETRSAGRGWL